MAAAVYSVVNMYSLAEYFMHTLDVLRTSTLGWRFVNSVSYMGQFETQES